MGRTQKDTAERFQLPIFVLDIAAEMQFELTDELLSRLSNVNTLCELVGGELVSRQVIAMIIEQYLRDKREGRTK